MAFQSRNETLKVQCVDLVASSSETADGNPSPSKHVGEPTVAAKI